MQDKYVGDIADFGKYGLLRYLCGETDPYMDAKLSLGIVWHFTKDGTSGGNSTDYLCNESQLSKLRTFDLPLYRKLQDLVNGKKRKISEVEQAGILPVKSNDYFTCEVKSRTHREKWSICAYKSVANVDIVFLDPNIGIQTKSNKGPNYARISELKCFVDRKQSVVVYQTSAHGPETDLRRIECLKEHLQRPVWTFHWGSRHFLIIPSKQHKDLLWDRLVSFRKLWEYGKEP